MSYLASCAVSLPLIGLTQLAQYVVFGKGHNLGPKELGERFKGATGHSQGVVSAAVIAGTYPAAASSSSASGNEEVDVWEPFYAQALNGLEVLFQMGLQGSLTFPPLALPPALTLSSIENGEGVPSPMLAVTGLDLIALEKQIRQVNGHVEGEGRKASVAVSLFNGSKAFVVTGSPKDLVGLTDGLRKGRAEAGKDQSKVCFPFFIFFFSFMHRSADVSTIWNRFLIRNDYPSFQCDLSLLESLIILTYSTVVPLELSQL